MNTNKELIIRTNWFVYKNVDIEINLNSPYEG